MKNNWFALVVVFLILAGSVSAADEMTPEKVQSASDIDKLTPDQKTTFFSTSANIGKYPEKATEFFSSISNGATFNLGKDFSGMRFDSATGQLYNGNVALDLNSLSSAITVKANSLSSGGGFTVSQGKDSFTLSGAGSSAPVLKFDDKNQAFIMVSGGSFSGKGIFLIGEGDNLRLLRVTGTAEFGESSMKLDPKSLFSMYDPVTRELIKLENTGSSKLNLDWNGVTSTDEKNTLSIDVPGNRISAIGPNSIFKATNKVRVRDEYYTVSISNDGKGIKLLLDAAGIAKASKHLKNGEIFEIYGVGLPGKDSDTIDSLDSGKIKITTEGVFKEFTDSKGNIREMGFKAHNGLSPEAQAQKKKLLSGDPNDAYAQSFAIIGHPGSWSIPNRCADYASSLVDALAPGMGFKSPKMDANAWDYRRAFRDYVIYEGGEWSQIKLEDGMLIFQKTPRSRYISYGREETHVGVVVYDDSAEQYFVLHNYGGSILREPIDIVNGYFRVGGYRITMVLDPFRFQRCD